jgi:hypothetical protein
MIKLLPAVLVMMLGLVFLYVVFVVQFQFQQFDVRLKKKVVDVWEQNDECLDALKTARFFLCIRSIKCSCKVICYGVNAVVLSMIE